MPTRLQLFSLLWMVSFCAPRTRQARGRSRSQAFLSHPIKSASVQLTLQRPTQPIRAFISIPVPVEEGAVAVVVGVALRHFRSLHLTEERIGLLAPYTTLPGRPREQLRMSRSRFPPMVAP